MDQADGRELARREVWDFGVVKRRPMNTQLHTPIIRSRSETPGILANNRTAFPFGR